MTLQLHPISKVDFAAFTDAFNLAYSDYYVPISMTQPAFHALFERDDIAPESSVVAVQDGQIVGTGLLGIRDRTGWIGGMGVIPAQRRKGIGRQMMRYLIEQARTRGLETIDLEVIEANRGAWHLYQSLGFTRRRYLLVLERVPDEVPTILPEYPLSEQNPFEILAHYDEYHPVPNCWQRARPSLEGMASTLRGWALWDDNCAHSRALGYADASTLRLIDLAATPETDAPRAAACLLAALHRTFPYAHASSYNVADNDPVLPAFEALGYMVSFRQIEMRLTL